MGADPERVVVFHSLSKRSNLPGLRSGFVAAAAGHAQIRQLRAFAGRPLAPAFAAGGRGLLGGRGACDRKPRAVSGQVPRRRRIFAGMQGYQPPEGGFFLWLPVEDGEAAALKLWREDRGAGAARRLSVARGRGENPGKGISGWRWWPQKTKRSAG
jgi:N-succinyldiaminopimelate aminotransferase